MPTVDQSAYPRFAPKLSLRELVTCYTPSTEEIEWSHSIARGEWLRYAALVLLKCFQQLHDFPEVGHIPREITSHLAEVMGLGTTTPFALSAATRYRQEAAIRRYLGIAPFYGKEGRRIAMRAATDAAPLVTSRVDLINAIIDALLQSRVEPPAYSPLVKVAEEVASTGEAELITLIDGRLTPAQRAEFDQLLHLELDRRRSAFDRLKRLPKRPSRDNLDALIDQCIWLDRFGDVETLLAGIPHVKLR